MHRRGSRPAVSPECWLGVAEVPEPVSMGYMSPGYIWTGSECRNGPGHTFTIEIDPNFTSFWGKQGALGIFVFAGL